METNSNPEKHAPDTHTQVTPTGEIIAAGHVESLPGFTTPVPDDVARWADQPVTDVEPTAAGQIVPTQVVAAPRRQRFLIIRNLVRSPKALVGITLVLLFVLVALLAPVIAP